MAELELRQLHEQSPVITTGLDVKEEKGDSILTIVSGNEDIRLPEFIKNDSDSRNPSATSKRIFHNLPDSRPFSRASSTRTHFAAIDPFDRFKVEDLTNYAMNDQRWTLQRKKIGLKRQTSGSKQRNNRSRQTKNITLSFVRNTFFRKECQRFEKHYKRSEILDKVVCMCGLESHLHGTFEPVKSPPPRYSKLTEQMPTMDVDRKRGFSLFRGSLLNKITEDYGGETNNALETEKNENQIPILKAKGITYDDRRRNRRISNEKTEVVIQKPNVTSTTSTTGAWDMSTVMAEYPTNAYGSITFVNETYGSNKPAKYVRLSDTSNLESVLALLTDYWRLLEPTRPNLILSVIGGAKNFRLDGKKKEVFNSGLIRAIKSTQAWLLTGGMQVGATKCVGEAVNEGQYMVKVKRKSFFDEEQERLVRGIKCIGVAPWGYTKFNETLINPNLTEFNQVKYKVEDVAEKNAKVSLNGDHSHFLLVDDGSRNKFSGADKFKTELQKLIQEPEPVGLGIPLVILLLDGGISSIFECNMALKNNTPVVIVANTGRAADLIAYGVSMAIEIPGGRYVFRKGHRKNLIARIVATMPELEKHQCENCADVIMECCARTNLITIFDINSNEGMDKYILYALLKGGAGNDESNKIDKLNLSLLWNRADIAETQIFPAYPVWPSETLEDLMTIALVEEKVEFVKLFVMNGLIMSDYLTVNRLRNLYNDTYNPDSHLGRLLVMCAKSRQSHLIHVHILLEALVKRHHDPVYLADTQQSFMEDPKINDLTFDDPYQELLLWAILSNRTNLARFLWERCNTPLVSAITATCIYESLGKSLGAKNTEMIDQYHKNKTIFEQLAVQYLDLCYKEDSNNAMGLIERRNVKWGELDVLQLARSANDMLFISSPCCQASVDISWRRGMIRASAYLVAIANFFPLLIFTRLFSFQKLGDNGGELTKFQKLIVFYKSPISKFCSHSSVFFLFLFLYSYVVLFDLRPSMTLTEKLILIWIFTSFLEEINEFFGEDSIKLKGKFLDWYSSVWNRFDALSYCIAFLAFILRSRPNTFRWGRILYAVNTNLFFIRLFRIYHVSYNLGPKLVIFYRMINEVLVFMSLLVIFILGYGIASQALLYPWRTIEETEFSTIVEDVFLTPYWQMYGELQLDKLQGDDVTLCPMNYEWNTTICENPKNYSWVAYGMLIFYLIIGNIMLLNLLIAIFTYVFDEVQENSMEIWKTEMYKLIREYDHKPVLVPPFVVIEHVYRISKYLWKRFCRKKRENLDDYMKETLMSLEIFEKEALATFLNRIKEKQEVAIESTISKMAEKIDRISKFIEQEEELKELEEDIEWSIDADGEKKKSASSSKHGSSAKSKIKTPLRIRKEVLNQKLSSENQPKLIVDTKQENNSSSASLSVGEHSEEDETDSLSTEESGNDEVKVKFLNENALEEDLEDIKFKQLSEGFTSLPFNMGSKSPSRPLSKTSINSRVRTAYQARAARARKTKLKTPRETESTSAVLKRITSLENEVKESQLIIENMLTTLTSKFENLERVSLAEKQKPEVSTSHSQAWSAQERKSSSYKRDPYGVLIEEDTKSTNINPPQEVKNMPIKTNKKIISKVTKKK